MRFLFSLALLYALYYLARGFFRQLTSPQQRRRQPSSRRDTPRRDATRQNIPQRDVPQREVSRPVPPPRPHGVDYSKVKDADYRDL